MSYYIPSYHCYDVKITDLMQSTTPPLFSQTTLSHASSLSSLIPDKTSHFLSSLKQTSSSFSQNTPLGINDNASTTTTTANYTSVADSALSISTLNNYNNYLSSGNSLRLNNAASHNALNRSIFNSVNTCNLYNNGYSSLYNFCSDLPSNNFVLPLNTQTTKPPPGFEKASKK